jgi:3-phosphoshikimate 1-carboxyvinyltransferase
MSPGIVQGGLQGDAGFVDLLETMGARVVKSAEGTRVTGSQAPLDALAQDMTLMPDAAMTLAAACCFAPGRSVIGGLRTLRVKETDRLAALQAELAKVGTLATVQPMRSSVEGGRMDEALVIMTPEGGIDCSEGVPRVEFETYKDHRMAMALALIGLRRPNVFIRDPGCVAKTYPTYWRDFAKLYGVEE